jgi:hypothetical protein
MPRLPSTGDRSGPPATPIGRPEHALPPSALPTSDCRNFHPPAATEDILPRSSLHPAVGIPSVAVKSRIRPEFLLGDRPRHATCIDDQSLEKGSQSATRSVNSGRRSAKESFAPRKLWTRRCIAGAERSAGRCGWNHGATGPGYRKRTRVRVACGVTIRPCGVGILSSHGHFGRSVEGSVLVHVVLEPASEASFRRRHLSRGPGLPAAALTTSSIGPPRMSALADSSSSATRRRRAVVNRAALLPENPARVPGGWTRRTRPDPRTRLPQV